MCKNRDNDDNVDVDPENGYGVVLCVCAGITINATLNFDVDANVTFG